MLPVPELTAVDVAFGNIKHMPKYADVPEQFKRDATPANELISRWFFRGLHKDDIARLKEKPGIDRNKALAAIKAVLGSFEPKHEHKEAACAFMLSEWFDLSDPKNR